MNNTQPLSDLFSGFELPCGIQVKNRLIKSAMSDSLGDGCGNPTIEQMQLYECWAQGGVAASIIGEVQGDPYFAEKPGNLVLNDTSDQQKFIKLATHATVNDTLCFLQLGHAGALTHLPITRALEKPKGPSKLELPELKCDEFSLAQIKLLPTQFAHTAKLAKQLGFSGVQIHAAHGFLLSQFLSPLFNRRTDQYGGNIENRMRLIVEVIEEVRSAVGSDFAMFLKINSSDQLTGGLTEVDSLRALELLNGSGLDVIDISGGTYFPGAKSSSDRSSTGAYFTEYAKLARAKTSIPLMATGGFKEKDEAVRAIASGAVDFVGIARALVLEPSLPQIWRTSAQNAKFPRFNTLPLPEGGITAWYTMQLTALAQTKKIAPHLDIQAALLEYENRDAQRTKLWNEKFQ